MLYTDHFGLRERPFTLVPDPDFMFWSEQHRRAFTVLEYGILSRAPITLLTGEIGAGKTTLVQAMLRHMEDAVTVGLVSNAQGGRGELVSWVLSAFGLPQAGGYVEMFRVLEDFLISEYASGRRVVLIFDEAQNLSAEGIEEVRLLTNINSGKDELVQLVLVGQPELRDMIAAPGMAQIAQRVAAAFHLRRMNAADVAEYLSHRMRHAGGTGAEFSEGAAALIAEVSDGVPRLVNQVADMALVYAWSNERTRIERDVVDEALADGLFFWRQPEEEGPGPADGPADGSPHEASSGGGASRNARAGRGGGPALVLHPLDGDR